MAKGRRNIYRYWLMTISPQLKFLHSYREKCGARKNYEGHTTFWPVGNYFQVFFIKVIVKKLAYKTLDLSNTKRAALWFTLMYWFEAFQIFLHWHQLIPLLMCPIHIFSLIISWHKKAELTFGSTMTSWDSCLSIDYSKYLILTVPKWTRVELTPLSR